ncbi:hypothetical protein OQX61_07480 [Pedobacter sp. PLR]|uniref:hypothetical protein n=1 Tax=Pedobacter sp. PLR TaxID=2994465 RepID=UPI0022483F13|nr:hypothetical protein [Pedobacter sp. PLR]MCX2451110.1 hypothetical protein [Pedobacter sp. PLR]
MHKQLLTLSVLCLLIIASCSKTKNDPEPDKELTCNVKLVEHTHSHGNANVTDKYYYSYDNEGRLTRVDYGKEQSAEFETYTYAANKVTWKGVAGDIEVYNLDANGRITTAVQGKDILNFKYNTDGNLIEAAVDGDIETLTYLNGNLVSASFGSSPWSTFTYGVEKADNAIVYSWIYEDKFLDFDEISSRVTPYIGQKSKYLPSKNITNPGINQSTNDYIYQKNASGKITSVQVSITDAPAIKSTEEYKFTYECK